MKAMKRIVREDYPVAELPEDYDILRHDNLVRCCENRIRPG